MVYADMPEPNAIDRRGKLNEEVFRYQFTKEGKVFLFWHGKQVMILKGVKAKKFIDQIETLDPAAIQLVIAKLTGNFKHGNER